jgi:malate dehydrogenase
LGSISYETLKKAGVSKPSVFGVTTLDFSRAKTFLGELKSVDPRQVAIHVIGGHSGPTIVPLFSSAAPKVALGDKELADITYRVQYGGDEVVKAKDGGGSATLSVAFAANEFVQRFIAALDGQKGIIENTFIYSEEWKNLPPYFAGLVELGPKGFQKIHALPTLSSYEAELLEKATDQLKKDIAKGVEFAHKQ